MPLDYNIAAIGLSLPNAWNCALASEMAYNDPPDILGPGTGTCVRILETEKALIVAFRGTSKPRDWLTDGEAWQVKDSYPLLKQMACGTVHAGFASAYRSVGLAVRTAVAASARPAVITGHSLGGALAVVCAADLVASGNRVAGVYTFGQPRPGDARFRDFYDFHCALMALTFRFVHEIDPIPRTPGLFMPPWNGFRHGGHEVRLPANGGYVQDADTLMQLWQDAYSLWRMTEEHKLDLLQYHFLAGYVARIKELFQPV